MNYLLRKKFIFAAVLFIFSNANLLFAGNDYFLQTLEVSGIAPVKNNNQAEARDTAVNDAMKKAVEKIIESMVSPEMIVENYSRINDIYANSRDYVYSFRFLSESFNEEGNIYSVKLEITLYSRYVKSILSSQKFLENNHVVRPKVLFIIRELGLFSSNEHDFWEKIPVSELLFLEKLRVEGISVVDRDALKDIVDLNLIQKSMKGDLQAVIQAGLMSGAKIVITGNAVARRREENLQGSAMASYQANISLKAYHTETGKILGARSEFISLESDDPLQGELNVLKAVGEKIYKSFLAAILVENENF